MSYCFVHTKLGSVHTTQVGKGGALIWLDRLVEKAQEVSRTAGLAPNGSRELTRQRAAHSNIYVTMGCPVKGYIRFLTSVIILGQR